MYPIPDTQHNHQWAKTLVQSKPKTFCHLDELQTFTPMYRYGLDGEIVEDMFSKLLTVTNRNRKAVRQALQCALLCLAQCATHDTKLVRHGFIHKRTTKREKVITRYKDRAFNDAQMTSVLDELADLGYVRYEKGFKGEDMPQGLGTLWLVETSFSDWLVEHGDSLRLVTHVEQLEVVVLNNDGEGARLKDYIDNDLTAAMRERVVAANGLRKQHQWTYMRLDRTLPEDGSLRRGKHKKEYRQFEEGDVRTLITPESLECRRVFKGDFESGGRFYCGAQSLRKAERATIQIDCESAVELDLKSLHPRLLYNIEGLEAPKDCYEADTPEQRARNKTICLYLINNKSRVTARKAFMADFGGAADAADAEFDAYIEQHPKIAKYFFESSWKRLQFMDSQIVDAVLSVAVEGGVPVLPVHDSFIVRVRDAFWLDEAVKEAYLQLIGFSPIVD